jgi:hypothetical protein
MVVVSAGAEEERAGVAPGHAVEADRLAVEGRGAVDVADVQMYVPDRCAGGHSRPRRGAGGAHQVR